MKLLIVITFMFASLSGIGQRDFDYSLTTRYRKINIGSFVDTSGERFDAWRIVKEGNTLRIIDPYCTANTQEYKLMFQGFSWMGKVNGYSFLDNNEMQMFFYYSSGDVFKEEYYQIFVNPVMSIVVIRKSRDKNYYDKYY